MANAARGAESVIPAQLSFLTLYNPSLGRTDETIHDQVVYYYSSKTGRARVTRRQSGGTSAQQQREEQNERLRQIGLAQGMVEFAKAFSNGENIDSIESEKSRILLHELEPDWWALASIDLTRLQSTTQPAEPSSASKTSKVVEEYSSREVCPQALLLQHLLRAHSIFLLHHGPSLAEIHARLSRQKFCGALERFWNKFVRDWDVLLHGNPAVEIFNGLKLAAGGELGIGVGEEEWGSGEREVLEGFVERTEGLVDLVVSRFGEGPGGAFGEALSNVETPDRVGKESEASPWLGIGSHPRSSDGVIFSGIGAITRPSLKCVSAWNEWLYKYGRSAYGAQDNVLSALRKKRRKINPSNLPSNLKYGNSDKISEQTQPSTKTPELASEQRDSRNSTNESPVGIPPPIITAAIATPATTSPPTKNSEATSPPKNSHSSQNLAVQDEEPFPGADAIVKYMTLGVYGSSWGFPLRRPPAQQRTPSTSQAKKSSTTEPRPRTGKHQKSEDTIRGASSAGGKAQPVLGSGDGFFLVGLQGDLDNEDITEDEDSRVESGPDQKHGAEHENWNTRVMVRSLYVERAKPDLQASDRGEDVPETSPPSDHWERTRVVVYVHQPFIFTFIFDLHTSSLSLPSFYHSLHHQLGPLQRPLLASTSPTQVASRLSAAASPKSTTTSLNSQPIYDLVYDPTNLTVHTTIPNIPEPGTAAAEGLGPSDNPWTRIEALNVHSQILNTYISTRRRASELERTCKTSRGWWVVWMRLPQLTSNPPISHKGANAFREAFLVRKASDYVAPKARMKPGMFGRDVSEGSTWGPGKLAEGIGIDPRRYIEGILSLNR